MSILYNNKSGSTPETILLAGNANTDLPHAMLNTSVSGRIGLVKSSNVSAATTYKVRLLWTTKPIYDNE